EPLQFQTESVSRFSELATWIHSHLNNDLSVETLAGRACLCPRHFSRRFKTEVGTSPADFVERLRLDEARRRPSNGDNSVETVRSVFCRFESRRRASFSRKFCTKSRGGSPKMLLNTLLKWLGHMHARRANTSTDRSASRFLITQATSSEKRSIG